MLRSWRTLVACMVPAAASDAVGVSGAVEDTSLTLGDGRRFWSTLEGSKLRVNISEANGFGTSKLLSGDWLRERCQCQDCVDMRSGQPLVDLHELAQHKVSSVRMIHQGHKSESTPDLALVVQLSSESSSESLHHTVCEFSIHFLINELQGHTVTIQADPIAYPSPRLWQAVNLVQPPVFDFSEVSQRGVARDRLITVLLTTGIAVLDDCPRRENIVVDFAKSVSTLRTTEWGDVFNVRTEPDTKDVVKHDLAYTPLGIGLHTDNPYRDPMPDFQLLHQIEGCECPDDVYPCAPKCHVDNFFSDGFAAAVYLKKHDPEAFKILTEVSVRWENNGGDRSQGGLLRVEAPHIELQPSRKGCYFEECLLGIRFSPKSGGYSPHFDDPDSEAAFFRARREFSRLLASDQFRIRVNARPGQMMIFDNRRVLHGRGFIQSDVARFVQGAYMNRDGLWYEFAKSQRRPTSIVQDAPTSHRVGPKEGMFAFKALANASKEQFDWVGQQYQAHVDDHLVTHLLDILKSQKMKRLGAPIDMFEHGIQTATRAYRANESEEIVVMSLLHDFTELIASKNHGGAAAAFLEPFLSEKALWMLSNHEVFQGYYYYHYVGGNRDERDRYRDHPWYNDLVQWCQDYDQAAFDATYPSLPLSFFVPMVKRVLSKPPYWWSPSHPKAATVTGVGEDGGSATLLNV